MDSLPNFVTHGALLRARFARARAPLLISFGDFFKFQFMSILSVHSNRQQETVSMPNYSPGPGCSNVG